jgi:hypothetical protein
MQLSVFAVPVLPLLAEVEGIEQFRAGAFNGSVSYRAKIGYG